MDNFLKQSYYCLLLNTKQHRYLALFIISISLITLGIVAIDSYKVVGTKRTVISILGWWGFIIGLEALIHSFALLGGGIISKILDGLPISFHRPIYRELLELGTVVLVMFAIFSIFLLF